MHHMVWILIQLVWRCELRPPTAHREIEMER
jgi:hypothetical protein